jgi:hypothetical protein
MQVSVQQARCNELGVIVYTWALYLETIVVSKSYSKRKRDKVSHLAACRRFAPTRYLK